MNEVRAFIIRSKEGRYTLYIYSQKPVEVLELSVF